MNVTPVENLEALLLEQPQFEIPTIERFVGNLYMREILIPKGIALTSRVYKKAYADIMLSGDITIHDSNGVYRLTGANVLEGPAGRKRAGYAHEDTRWVTVHDSSDIKSKDPIEDISFITMQEFIEERAALDKDDFRLMLEQTNIDAETIRGESERTNYLAVTGPWEVKDSPIEGKGVFSQRPYVSGEVVGSYIIDGNKTQLGRYINHSNYPNVGYSEGKMIAIRAIETGHELTADYRYSPAMRSKLCQAL